MIFDLTIAEVIAPFTRNRSIPPDKVRAFRERRGWTHEQMADEVCASPLEVAAWEAGTVRVPAEQARRMRTIAAATPLAPVPGLPALPRCAWAEAQAPGLYEILWCELEIPSEVQVQRHVAECPACQRVIQRDKTTPLPGPAPDRAPMTAAEELGPDMSTWEIFVLLVIVAVLLVVMFTPMFVWPDPGTSGADLGFAMLAGFLAFDIAGRITRSRLPRQPYASGLLSALGGMLAGMLTWTLQDTESNLFNSLVLAGCALAALLVGLLTGWMRDGYEPDDAEPLGTEADATPPAPAVRLQAPDPLAGLDRARGHGPEHAGAPVRERA